MKYRQPTKTNKKPLAIFFLLFSLIAVFLLNKNNRLSSNGKSYESIHFSMNRYLFKRQTIYKKRGKYFYRTSRSAKKGYYTAKKRMIQKYRHNFLYFSKVKGWIKEVYTSAAPRFNWEGGNLSIGNERIDKWYALPADYRADDLVRVPMKYCKFRRIKLRKEAATAFKRMVKHAKRMRVAVYGFSGFRSYAVQRYLFLRRIRIGRKHKQQSVARPGHSEHQLGTTVDVVGNNTSLAAKIAFKYTRAAKWIKKYCYNHGFVLSYSENNKIPSGYIYESWHLRYIGKKNIKAWKRKHLR